jgi:drug/metabolite transporter (DMT)-like permease
MWMLIEQISATRVASLFYMGPPVTMFMAWVIFDDKVQLWDILGLVVIVTGLLITRVNFKKQMARLKN